MTPTSTLRDRVLLGVAAQPSRTRSQGRLRALILLAMAALASTGPPILRGALDLDGASVAVGSLLVAFACVATATWRGKALLGHSAWTLAAVALLAPLARALWLFAWARDAPDTPDATCFARTLVSTAPIFAALFFLRVRRVVEHPFAHGAALGTAAAAFGAVLVDVSCARAPPSHVLVGHVLPVLAFAALGTLCGRFLAVRARS
jgi:hypothetical protein